MVRPDRIRDIGLLAVTVVVLLTPLAGARPSTIVVPPAYHANLYVNASAPTAATAPGTAITAEYSVQSTGYPGSPGPATITVPSAVVMIPTTDTLLHLYLAPVNLTLTGNASAEATAGPASKFGTALTFNTTGTALLSSQGIALMASWPHAQVPVEFRWRWAMSAPDGSTTEGTWSAWQSVVPAALAAFVPDPPHTWTLGSPYMTCLTGPLAGRSFSLHVSTANPVAQYDGGEVTVPTSGPGTTAFCWNSTLPTSIVPQQAFIHLWEFANLTYLLDVVLIELAAPGSGTAVTPPFTPPAINGWSVVLVAGAIIAAVIVGVELYLLAGYRRAHRPPPPPPPAASGSTPSAFHTSTDRTTSDPRPGA